MSYPVCLYPRLLVDFRRDHPLPTGDSPLLTHDQLPRSVPSNPVLKVSSTISSGTDLLDAPVVLPATAHSGRLLLSSPLLLRWFAFVSLVFGILGFNLVAVGNLPKNLQSPVRAVSFLGAAFAVAGMVVTYKRRADTLFQSPLPVPAPGEQPPQTVLAGTVLTSLTPSAAAPPDPRWQLVDYLELLKVTLTGNVLQPVGVSDAPVGKSEDAFASYLESYFPGRIRRQLEFPIQNGKGRSFSTDFAFVLEEVGLCIDIEIDEPYDLRKKRPTHCVDDYHDQYRNGFFLPGNWIIIRFAEEQVVRYPKSCCREIALCVFQVTGLDRFLKPLLAEPVLRPIPQWSKKEARHMAKVNYRDTYLSLLAAGADRVPQPRRSH